MNREDIHCNLPFADYETVMALADKGRLLQTARSARLPVPDFSIFDRASQVDVKRFSGYPLVVKPCLSHIWTGDRWISTTVRVVNSREELSEVLRATPYLRDYPFMIQSFIPGSGAGIFALFDSGEPVTWFAHRRIREKPPRGGVSVLSESVAVDSRLKDYAEVLLRSVNWHGVAMVEFRVAEDGTPYLMEVNTRFWGSLQLAIDAGVDFPRLLWEVSTNKSVPHHDPYRVGQRLRWLLGDLDSLYLSLKDRKFSGREKLARVLGFITPGGSRCRHEVNRWDDLRPALFELRQYLRDLLGRTPNDSQAPSRYREHTIKSNSAR
ncbi:carboxylate--amine ligase [Gilvimarinus sp. F26214L]|uniref:carboxylate--amine ligase n=1 Tax=Gilvimarinus sp. DZF01 TaxID=3461371 RepID=UPI0040457CB4